MLKSMGLSLGKATVVAAIMDATRVATFILMIFTAAWHGRRWVLVVTAVMLPMGFLCVLFAPTVAGVIAGELVFGVAIGLAYYAALYYAMVVHNASVDAGGAHEALIGSGFALGPAVGLIGVTLGPLVGDRGLGMLIGISPMVVVFLVAALRPLVRGR
jgi:hypothetical protein